MDAGGFNPFFYTPQGLGDPWVGPRFYIAAAVPAAFTSCFYSLWILSYKTVEEN